MTLADRLAEAILEHGPMAECHLATTVRKRRDVVTAELVRNPERFVHNGLKARASRWDVSPVPSIDATEAALRWRCDIETARTIIFGEGGFVERGYVASLNGNGRVFLTERGLEVAALVEWL